MNSIANAVADAFAGQIAKTSARRAELLAPLLAKGEQLIGFQEGEIQAPFVVRLIPVIGDLFGKAKHYLIAVTSGRVLIVQLARSFTGQESIRETIASVPLEHVERFVPGEGAITSSLTVEAAGGQRWSYTNMLRSAPAMLCDSLADAQGRRKTGGLSPSK